MGRARRPETRASSKEQEAAEALTCLAAASREAQQDSESIGSSDEEESNASSRERLRPNAWQSYKEVDPTQPDVSFPDGWPADDNFPTAFSPTLSFTIFLQTC